MFPGETAAGGVTAIGGAGAGGGCEVGGAGLGGCMGTATGGNGAGPDQRMEKVPVIMAPTNAMGAAIRQIR